MKLDKMMTRLVADITFIEPLLGTMAGNPKVVEDHIIGAAEKKGAEIPEELKKATLDSVPKFEEEVEKVSTFFCRDENGNPALWDYMFKGFFKAACYALRDIPGSLSSKLKAYQKRIDGHVFAYPRLIPLVLPDGGVIDMFERPLRGQTPQGERVALARSERTPIGTKCRLEIGVLKPDLIDFVEEWLDYGELKGMGQWRNASYGRFTYEWVKDESKAKAR